MKKYLFIAALIALSTVSHAQDPRANQALVDSLTKKALQLQGLSNRDLIRRNPDSVLKVLNKYLKFTDSTRKAIVNDALNTAPNGDVVKRLLATQTATDTSYTTVQFTGNLLQQSQHNDVYEQIVASCQSATAPLVHHGSTYSITLMSVELTPGTLDYSRANVHGSLAKYMANQQGISGMASYTGHVKSSGFVYGKNQSWTVSRQSMGGSKKMQFVFSYDTLTNIGQVSFISYVPISVTNDLDANPNSYITQGNGVGISAVTDPAGWRMDALNKDSAMRKMDTLTGGKLLSIVHITSGGAKPVLTVIKTLTGFVLTCDFDHTENGQTMREHITAYIGRPLTAYQALIYPVVPLGDAQKNTYKHWLPKGPKPDGSDNTTPGDSLQFYVVVKDIVDPTRVYHNYTVKWAITEATNYKGICSNYPINNPQDDPDLKIAKGLKNDINFDPASITDGLAASKPGKGEDAIVKVYSIDYAAWGKISATITLDNGTVLVAKPYYDENKTYLTMPFDDDENKFADYWEDENHILNKGYGPEWDDDDPPTPARTNSHKGDDIRLIDEYRGFAITNSNGAFIHQRLSPEVKELFTIQTSTAYSQEVKEGVENFTTITGVKIYHITKGTYIQSEPGTQSKYNRWLNFNSPINQNTYGVAIEIYTGAIIKPSSLGYTKSLVGTDAYDNAHSGAFYPAEVNYVFIQAKEIIDEEVAPKANFVHPACVEDPSATNTRPCLVTGLINHIEHVNTNYHYTVDGSTLSTTISANVALLVSRLITVSVTHELCHATHIHHHHLAENFGSYLGDEHCPMRYWLDPSPETPPYCTTHNDWFMAFLSTQWNPTAKLADGMSYQLCTADDDCFDQMDLKPGNE